MWNYTDQALLDEVDSLPGFLSLKSRVFSGYLSASRGKYIHYIYVESENDPGDDPVTFWTNGGPGIFRQLYFHVMFLPSYVLIGCSGLIGLFTGNPLYVTLLLLLVEFITYMV